MRAPLKSLLSVVLALIVLGAIAPVAHAQFQRSFLVKRPGLYTGKLGPGAARKCAGNLTLAAPGKSWDPRVDAITGITVTRSATPGCTGGGSATFSGDSFFVSWSGECIQPGDFAIVTITASSAFEAGGVVWKDNFNTVVSSGDVTKLTFPALDARGTLLLVAGLGVLGWIALRRRRETPNAI